MQLTAEPPLSRECWNPPKKKDTPQPRAKEKLQQDRRRGSTAFKSKRHAHQRHVEGTHQDPGKEQRAPPETGPGMPVSVCGSPVEAWVSRGLPRGRGSGSSRPGRRSMWHKTATITELPAWATHKLENNYTRKSSHCSESSGPRNRLVHLAKGLRIPGDLASKGSRM